MRRLLLILTALVGAWGSASSLASARAPDTFEEQYTAPSLIDSPMWMALELKLGPYVPGGSDAFKRTFGDDKGWMLAAELQFTVWEIPHVGQLNLGAGFAWANYDAGAIDSATNQRSDEKTEFTLYPLSALAVLRVDALARNTSIPLTFAGKLGADFVRWKATTGGQTDDDGLNIGMRWAAQVAFELDWFDRRAARRMDEEWGINHMLVLFEFIDSLTRGTGDRTFQVGLGVQF